MSPKIKTHNLFVFLGMASIFLILGFHFATQWEWSFLMDDVSYNHTIPQMTGVVDGFLEELRGYWTCGRFYPVKYLANILKWRFLPLNPELFHLFNLAVLITAVLIAGLSFVSTRLNVQNLKILIWLGGVCFLQRPLLDVIALNSLGETWVIFFLALGIWAYPKWGFSYRALFLLAALSKEPAVCIFIASGLLHAVGAVPHRSHWRRAIHAGIDWGLAAALTLTSLYAVQHGTYLSGYSLVSPAIIKNFAVGMIKCSLGLLPFLFLGVPDVLGRPKEWKNRLVSAYEGRWALALLFGLGYLFLAVGKGTAGYLLIPSSFAFTLAAFGLWLPSVHQESFQGRRWLKWGFGLAFFAILSVSFIRYKNYVSSINDPARAMQLLLLTNEPRLIFINGEEATHQGNLMAKDANPRVEVVHTKPEENVLKRIEEFKGDVVLFELSRYFGPLDDSFINTVGNAVGGWQQTVDKNSYRLFYGQHR